MRNLHVKGDELEHFETKLLDKLQDHSSREDNSEINLHGVKPQKTEGFLNTKGKKLYIELKNH